MLPFEECLLELSAHIPTVRDPAHAARRRVGVLRVAVAQHRVAAELPHLGDLPLQAQDDERIAEHAEGADAEQGDQREQSPAHGDEAGVRLGDVHLGRDAELPLGQPRPAADHRHAAVVRVADDVDAGLSRDRARGHAGERAGEGRRLGQVARGEVAARVADVDVQRRGGAGLVGHQPECAQLILEAAVRDEPAVGRERVGLAGFSRTRHAEDA